jgi:hypothetical protein
MVSCHSGGTAGSDCRMRAQVTKKDFDVEAFLMLKRS